MDERERYQQGMSMRRAVLGDAHVDRALQNRNEFNETLQDLITRYAWGEIWTRPGVPRQTRSLITLAIMVALNRSDELRMHLRAAFNNGVTREEIKEVLLQTAIYCGVPAAKLGVLSRGRSIRGDEGGPRDETLRMQSPPERGIACGLPYQAGGMARTQFENN